MDESKGNSCVDTDGGKNYFEKGITKSCQDDGSCVEFSDDCGDDGQKLIEYYCDEESQISRDDFNCTRGCEFGACSSANEDDSFDLILNDIEIVYPEDTGFRIGTEDNPVPIMPIVIKPIFDYSGTPPRKAFYIETKTFYENGNKFRGLGGKKSVHWMGSEFSKIGYETIIREQNGPNLKFEPGYYVFYFKLDSENDIKEADESNNELKKKIFIGEFVPINQPIDLPIDEEIKDKKLICSGCVKDNKCFPIGYRLESDFCNADKEFVGQSSSGAQCNNNHECSSNVCVGGECIAEGFINKIINWFKRLFG